MHLPQLRHIDSGHFFLIAGPCVVENEALCFQVAESMLRITDKLRIPYVFKASYRKANRTRHDSFQGIGDKQALEILSRIRRELQVPVLTDIHTDEEAFRAAEHVDILQIPAFLCRQTSLLQAAGQSGAVVNIKKGQFLSPEAMQFAVNKVRDTGNSRVMVTERGTTFGYQDLVVDFRGIPVMQAMGVPVVMDGTHSVQQPNQTSGVTGGIPGMIQTLVRAAIAVGVDGVFLETHPKPAQALSDGANMLPLDHMEALLTHLLTLDDAVRSWEQKSPVFEPAHTESSPFSS